MIPSSWRITFGLSNRLRFRSTVQATSLSLGNGLLSRCCGRQVPSGQGTRSMTKSSIPSQTDSCLAVMAFSACRELQRGQMKMSDWRMNGGFMSGTASTMCQGAEHNLHKPGFGATHAAASEKATAKRSPGTSSLRPLPKHARTLLAQPSPQPLQILRMHSNHPTPRAIDIRNQKKRDCHYQRQNHEQPRLELPRTEPHQPITKQSNPKHQHPGRNRDPVPPGRLGVPLRV